MKKFSTILMAIMAVSSVTTFAAEKTPQELQALQNANNRTLDTYWRNLSGMVSNDSKPRDVVAVNSNLTEMVKLIKLSEAPANQRDEAAIHYLVATVYSPPNKVNLTYFDLAKKHYLEAIRLSSSPDQKAYHAFQYASFMWGAAMEGDAAQWDKAKLDAYNTEGITPMGRVSLLKLGVPGLELEEEGLKIAKDDAKARREVYKEVLEKIRKNNVYGNGSLDPKLSAEHALELIDKAEADSEVMALGHFSWGRIEILKSLERYDEVKKILVNNTLKPFDLTKGGDLNAKAEALMALGNFFVERASRYYAKPNEQLLRNAVCVYSNVPTNALRHYPNSLLFSARALYQIGDYQAAIEMAKRHVAITKDQKGDRFDNQILGDCYYELGDYEKAVEHFDRFDDGNVNHQDRYGRACFAVGRYEDAIAHIKRSYNNWTYRAANAYFIRKIEEKIAEQKAKSE